MSSYNDDTILNLEKKANILRRHVIRMTHRRRVRTSRRIAFLRGHCDRPFLRYHEPPVQGAGLAGPGPFRAVQGTRRADLLCGAGGERVLSGRGAGHAAKDGLPLAGAPLPDQDPGSGDVHRFAGAGPERGQRDGVGGQAGQEIVSGLLHLRRRRDGRRADLGGGHAGIPLQTRQRAGFRGPEQAPDRRHHREHHVPGTAGGQVEGLRMERPGDRRT